MHHARCAQRACWRCPRRSATALAQCSASEAPPDEVADAFRTVGEDLILRFLSERNVRSERQLLFQLRKERSYRGGGDAELPRDRVHAELCKLCRERMLTDVASSAKLQRAPADARREVQALCERESTRAGSFWMRLSWAIRGLPLALWSRLPQRTLQAGVPRVHSPSERQLYDDFVSRNLPCIITGALDPSAFPPLRTFKDCAYLRGRCGHRHVPVKGHYTDDEGRRVFFNRNDEVRRVTLSRYLDALDLAAANGRTPDLYLAKVPLRDHLQELAADVHAARVSPETAYGACFGPLLPDGVHMYFGGGGNTTPTHFDAYENLMLVVEGTKRLLLFPPGECDNLYVTRAGGAHFAYSAIQPMVRPQDRDRYESKIFPRFNDARCIEVEVHAGEVLYLPIYWWHGVSGTGRNCILNWWFDMSRKKEAH